MSNSNNLNICTRCGTANSLSAKFCYQCGNQLKVPEQPVVCPKCHTVNAGFANFCKHCATSLRDGGKKKLCPVCSSSLPVEQSQCKCGYKFGKDNAILVQDTAPLNKGGRIVAIFSMIFLAIIIALYAVPNTMRPAFMKNICLFYNATTMQGFEYVIMMFNLFKTSQYASMSVAGWVTLAVFGIFVLCLVIHAISAIIRLFTNKKSRHANGFYLFLAIVSALAIGLLALGGSNLLNRDGFFAFLDLFKFEYSFGYLFYCLPAYYVFFWLFSLIAKVKKVKKA